MMKLKFEWNETKARSNWRRHGVSFELATSIFKDPFAIERLDDRLDYGEPRFVVLGMAEGQAPCSLSPTLSAKIEFESSLPRRATPDEEEDYFRQNR